MPIFELDDGRPRLVQPMQPLAGSFAQEVTALVTHHLAAVAGEPLFVVRRRADAERGDLPELLALDASGRPVVVDVAQVLWGLYTSTSPRGRTSWRMAWCG